MTGIKTDPNSPVGIDPIKDPGKVGDGRPDAVLLPGGILKEEHHAALPRIGERPVDGSNHPLPPFIGPGAPVMPEVGHEVGYPEETAPPEFTGKRLNRLFIDRIVRRSQVWEVGHMVDDGTNPRCAQRRPERID